MEAAFDLGGLSKGQRPSFSFSASPSTQTGLFICQEAKCSKDKGQIKKVAVLAIMNLSTVISTSDFGGHFLFYGTMQ